jgi:hypothetical protein
MKPDERKMRDLLAGRLGDLLSLSHPSQHLYYMAEVERLLREAGLEAGSPRRDDPRTFASDLFQENPGTYPLVADALQKAKGNPNWSPASETPDDLVASLLPSDQHLE